MKWIVSKATRAVRFMQRGALSVMRSIAGASGPVVFRSARSKEEYERYVARQKEKTIDRTPKLLDELWEVKLEGFRRLFGGYDSSQLGQRALCIGARTGQEVVALKELGLDAIGIDLVACPPYVIEGDMHKLPFGDEEFDFVFSNCFDHSPLPETMIAEMERVCRGHIALWLQRGITTDYYAENLVVDAGSVVEYFSKSDVVWAKPAETTFDGMDFSILMQKRRRS